MLVLSVSGDDDVVIDPHGRPIIVRARLDPSGKIRLCFDAPPEVKILRGELLSRAAQTNRPPAAAKATPGSSLVTRHSSLPTEEVRDAG